MTPDRPRATPGEAKLLGAASPAAEGPPEARQSSNADDVSILLVDTNPVAPFAEAPDDPTIPLQNKGISPPPGPAAEQPARRAIDHGFHRLVGITLDRRRRRVLRLFDLNGREVAPLPARITGPLLARRTKRATAYA